MPTAAIDRETRTRIESLLTGISEFVRQSALNAARICFAVGTSTRASRCKNGEHVAVDIWADEVRGDLALDGRV